MKFRKAIKGDEAKILMFIEYLAEYEHLRDMLSADKDKLAYWLFEKDVAHVLFALDEEGKEVGFALYFYNFSTFLAKAGLYLEDLYVLKEYRGQGYGKGLLKELAKICVSEGLGRFEWQCLDWNKPSIDFYLSLGAEVLDDWHQYRLNADKILKLDKED